MMIDDPGIPAMSLAKALQIAVKAGDAGTACATLRVALGVADNGCAATCFSDLAESPSTGQTTWAQVPPTKRHQRLIGYLKEELDRMPNFGKGQMMAIPGFSPKHIGAGCRALAKELSDKTCWLVTAGDGASLPHEGDEVIVAHFAADGITALFQDRYPAGTFQPDALLAHVAAAERSADLSSGHAQGPWQSRFTSAPEEEAAFEAFQATRQEMTAKDYADLTGNASWKGNPHTRLLVYGEHWWIEALPDGRHKLVLGGQSWTTGDDTELEDLERIVFRFSLTR